MPIRYFKATNGRFTIFRQSPSRDYRSAWIQCSATRVTAMGFSEKPVGAYPLQAYEITRDEYHALNQLKLERIIKGGGQPKYAAPSDSWIAHKEVKP